MKLAYRSQPTETAQCVFLGNYLPSITLKHSPVAPAYADKWPRILGVPLITAFEYYLTYDHIQFNGLFLYEVTSDALKILLIWQLVRWLVVRLDGYLPWTRGLVRRLAVQVPLTCLAGIALLTVLVHLEYRFIRPYPMNHFFNFDVVVALIFLLGANVVYLGLYWYDAYRRSLDERAALVQQVQALPVMPALPPKPPGHFVVRLGRRETVVPLEDILCFYSEEKETYLLTRDDKTFLMELSLDKLETQLQPSLFFRANRKFIFTPGIIETVQPDTYGKLTVRLKPHSRLPELVTISRDKAPAFREWLKS